MKAEGSTAFLKKSSKKLSFTLHRACDIDRGPDLQKFFGSFFQKRTAFFTLTAVDYPKQWSAMQRRDVSGLNFSGNRRLK
jgi:hypothetical protein